VRTILAGLALLGTTLWAGAAHAWEIHDPLHKNCHERITQAAVRRAGYVKAPVPLDGEDARLARNLEFPADPYDPNFYAISLVLGVRTPDTQGVSDFGFYDLAIGANAKDEQGQHCLRSETEDGPEGDAAAVRDCRSVIEAEYWRALSTLDASGNVDPDMRESVEFNTAFQGQIDYPLSGFYYHAGRAMHAVEDSFTHTFRTADWKRIEHVFNWVDQVSCHLQEARDGHGHEKVLDQCETDIPSRDARLAAAVAAATDFMAALVMPGSRAERQIRLDAFFDAWMSYSPGCSQANGYCHDDVYAWLLTSPKSDIGICSGPFGCSSSPVRPLGGMFLIAAAALVLAARRRRRLAASALVLALLWPREARADADGKGFHVEGRASLSVENPAYALGAAALWSLGRAEVGGFLELNPWYGVERHSMNLGVTNAGVLAHWLLPLRPDLRLRFGAGLGLSMLNEEMIGTPAGKLGLYANVRLVGLVWQWTDRTALTVDPFDLALPAPQLTGWPLLRSQYRFSVGVQFWM
jgi:uncharacterized protein (TIGR03382 family)